MVLYLFEIVQMVPPVTQLMIEDEFEPGCQRGIDGFGKLVNVLARNPADLADLVGVRVQGDLVFLNEQHIVDLVLTPVTITRCLVVNPRHIRKLVRFNFVCWNS